MLRVGLTGGLAAGKTTVARMFSDLGAQVIQADLIARELLDPGQPVYHEVVRHFGREILASDGRIHRADLARVAFGEDRIQELNELIHPEVIRRQEQWMDDQEAANPQSIAVVEAALIFEAGIARRFDKLVVVAAPEPLRIERYVRRMCEGPDRSRECGDDIREDARRRIAAQIPEEQRIAAADYTIDNSGTPEATRHQVERVFRELKRKARLAV